MGAKSYKKNVKQHSYPIENIDEFIELANRYANVKNYVFSRFSGVKSLPILKSYKKEIRDKWTTKYAMSIAPTPEEKASAIGFAEQWKLPARYWKLALDEAISNIKTEWSNTKNRVKDAVVKNNNLTDYEKTYIFYILKAEELYNSIMNYKDFKRPEKITELVIREKYVHNLIRRYSRKYKGSIAYTKNKRSFELDANLYKYEMKENTLFIRISGLVLKERWTVKLKDNKFHKGNLRIVINEDKSITINRCKNVEVKSSITPKSKTIGIDKGYTTMLATSSNTEYGVHLGEMLTIETERMSEKNKKRNKIWATMNVCSEKKDSIKASRIKLNNFGKIKYNKQKNRFNERMKSYINHSIYQMIEQENPKIIVLESLKFQSSLKKLPKNVNRKLSRWVKGYIQERLEYIATSKGIKIEMINPAYTSQTCSECGCFGVRNGKTFTCPKCGISDADINAAHNIKNRYKMKEISIYTPYTKVKEILIKKVS